MFTKVCLVGATGNLGKHVLHQLLQSTTPSYVITILTTRDNISKENITSFLPSSAADGSDSIPQSNFKNIQTIKVNNNNYNDHAQIVSILKEQQVEVIVSALNSVTAIDVDVKLLEAAKEARCVRRIFPSEYTLDVLHPTAVRFMGEDHPRVKHARMFDSASSASSLFDGEEGMISATTLVSGMFLDLAMQGFHGNFDIPNKKAMLIDGGNVFATGSSSAFIAACIVAALKMPEEITKNKRIRIAEVKYTGRQILDVLEEVIGGEKFTVVDVPHRVAEERYEEAKQKGSVRETFVLPVGILNFSAVDNNNNPCGAGLLEEGLMWNGGGFLSYRRKTLLEIAKVALA
jgi:nucleoside-diphosphate-sugar epimerase